MSEIRIISWNVNGIRAAQKKGLLDWLQTESPGILCVQETKARPEQLDDILREPKGYYSFWNYPERKGYSGVATYSREEPINISYKLDGFDEDIEGRIVTTEYPGFTLMNVYFPNGKANKDRLDYKMRFYEAFLRHAEALRNAGKKVVICGDVNTAHKEIDLAHPKANEKVSGFLPVERDWIDRLLAHGFVDTFRQFHEEPEQYSWWDQKTRARDRNIGWRIDYFFVSDTLLSSLTDAFILPEVMGSDHCPIGITLQV